MFNQIVSVKVVMVSFYFSFASSSLEAIFELNLLAPGGTLAVDNALGGGYPYSHENPMNRTSGPAIEKFNDIVRAETGIHRVCDNKLISCCYRYLYTTV